MIQRHILHSFLKKITNFKQVYNQCFKYNGSAWTSSGSLATATKQGAGTGIQTAALCCGGEVPAVTTITQEFNGSTWSSGGAMSQSRNNNSAFGIQTDAVTVGGSPSPGAQYNAEEYDGTSWSVGNPLNKSSDAGIDLVFFPHLI